MPAYRQSLPGLLRALHARRRTGRKSALERASEALRLETEPDTQLDVFPITTAACHIPKSLINQNLDKALKDTDPGTKSQRINVGKIVFRFHQRLKSMIKNSLKPPIIIDESGDTDIFESVGNAERYLEPIDVENNMYTGYDSEGRLLALIPTHPRVTITYAEQEPTHKNHLRKILVDFLMQLNFSENDLTDKSLQELIEISLKYKTV
jgi:hypothetical protein